MMSQRHIVRKYYKTSDFGKKIVLIFNVFIYFQYEKVFQSQKIQCWIHFFHVTMSNYIIIILTFFEP